MDAQWLRALGEDRLAGLLTHRPEVTTPAPSSLSELAARLSDPTSVLAALRRLVLPSAQVAEAIAALPAPADRPSLDRLLGATEPADVAAVDRALADLTEHGLLTATEAEALSLVPTVRYAWDSPLGLGPSVAEFLDGMAAGPLRAMADRLGAPRRTGKDDLVEAITAALRNPDLVQAVVASAPQQIKELLLRVAGSGEHVMLEDGYGVMRRGWHETQLRWAVERGLLLSFGPWDCEFVMPSEVTLSLRGPDYTAPFDAREPICPRIPVEPGTVARDASAAAGAFLRLAISVLDEASRTHVATMRAGGVGIRELRRLAKMCGTDVDAVRLVLAVLHRGGLLAVRADGATPTAKYDAWLEEEPAARLTTLIHAWWSLPYAPLAAPGAWEPSTVDNGTALLRAGTLRLLAAEPGAPTDAESFVQCVRWRHPFLLHADAKTLVAVVVATRVEATALGVIGAGTVSDAGLALLANDRAALALALANVGKTVGTAHLQADLTAVVSGTPSAALAEVLAAVAIRESSGAASVWRFSPDSVRRALDVGWAADAVIAKLEAIATNGVPQPLTYLIRDVERRHGAIRASTVVCCLRSDDAALLAEVAADRRLRGLGLRLLAPTVLAGAKPLPETIAALRKAGYAPVEESADGSAVLETVTRRRTMVAPRSRPADSRALAAPGLTVAGASGVDDGRALARTLLGRPDGRVPASSAATMGPSLGFADLDEDDGSFVDFPPPRRPQTRYPRVPRRRWY